MNDGLNTQSRSKIISVLAACDKVERVVLFGSRALGTFRQASDVDLCLFGDQLETRDLTPMSFALEDLTVAQSVDLLIFDNVGSKTLREHITRQGIEWYNQKED